MDFLRIKTTALQNHLSRIATLTLAFIVATSLLLTGCSANTVPGEAAASDPLQSKVAIIHTNDVHGYDMPAEPTDSTPGVIGIAAVAQLKKDYESQGYEVLLLDDGDAIQGNVLVNLSQGNNAIAFMNSAGYNAMSIGNHEFDWGADNLEKLIDEASFSVLAANIIVDATGEPFAEEHTVFELSDGLKIGVFGLATPETQTKSSPKNTYGLTFLSNNELYQCAQEQIDYLRGEGCTMIICLGHLGSIGGTAPDRSLDVLQNTEGIDLFIDGHDHEVVNETVNETLLVSTGCYLANIGVVLYEDGVLSEQMITYGNYDGVDAATASLVNEANAKVDSQFATVIGSTSVTLNGERDPGVRTEETNLGDFAADALLWQATQAADDTIDAALVNGGNIRDSIDVGDISMKTMLTVFPYNNGLNVVTLTGSELLEVLEAALWSLPEAVASFPQVAGITYSINTAVPYENGELYPNSTYYAPAAPGTRVTITDVGGRGFSPDVSYTLAASSFLTDGGDTYYRMAEAYQSTGYYTGYTDTEALINYIQTALGGVVGDSYSAPQGRITLR